MGSTAFVASSKRQNRKLSKTEMLVARIENDLRRKGMYSVPGTMIHRSLLDAEIARKKGFKVKDDSASLVVWCAALGGIGTPKICGYGLRIPDALQRAWILAKAELAARKR